MAALVAGTTHAPLTAIVMLYEITREPKVILPVMFAATVAMAGAQLLCSDSIYTLKLRRRGVPLRSVVDLTVLRRITADEVERQPAVVVHPEDPLQTLIQMAGETDAVDFVVVDERGLYQGMVSGKDVRTALLQPEAVSLLVVEELMMPGVPTVTPRETLDVVLERFALSQLDALPLASASDRGRVEGLLTREAVLRRYHEELQRDAG
jgi:CIC family chloride channel protein